MGGKSLFLLGLHEFEKKPIRSADQANLDLLKDSDKKIVDTTEEPQDYEEIFKHLLKTIKVTLADRTIDVKDRTGWLIARVVL